MRVRIVKEQTIHGYAAKHAESRKTCEEWIGKVRSADWESPEDIKCTFGSADILGNGTARVVFNLGGNNHRIICDYSFRRKSVALYVSWIGTHDEYSKLCQLEGQYDAENFKNYG
ncbi:MAG: type II toxin-antitoxin system HigB family toxin [Bacteroidota bacterium]